MEPMTVGRESGNGKKMFLLSERLHGGAGHYAFVTAVLFLLIVGCAPAMYSVNMQYVPTGSIATVEKPERPIAITVATFEDTRNISEPIKIGQVTKSNGETIPVFPKFVWPSRIVTDALKGIFRKKGYSVSSDSPSWNVKEADIGQRGTPVLIGGSIDELEVLCIDSLIGKSYSAKVRLTFVIADARRGKIIYQSTTNSSASLEHVLFSEEQLENEINTALSDALEKIFEDKKITNSILEAAGP